MLNISDKKPVIGIILDWEEEGSFSNFPYFALRTHYIEAVKLSGGIPWLIPYGSEDLISHYLDKIDGLLAPGGLYATPDEWYQTSGDSSPYKKTPRFEFEEKLIKQALETDKPLLCICAGMQVLGGLLGCKLTSNVKNYLQSNLDHFDLSINHDVSVEAHSLLHKIVKKLSINTNSHHNEAIISVVKGVKISAKASDGAIEAIELENKKFALGVQWHPEMMTCKEEQLQAFNPHHLIFNEFINASRS